MTDRPARRLPLVLLLLAVLVVGVAAPVARLAIDGFSGRAAVLGALGLGWLLLLELRPRNLAGVVLLGGVAIAAALLAWPTIGRAPVLVALSAMLVAHAALVEWRPTAGWPPRNVQVTGLAMLPLVAAGVLWFRIGSPALTASLLVLALAIVETYHRSPTAARHVDNAVVRGIVALANLVAAALLFVVVLVVLYLPGSLGALRDRVRRGSPRASYWFERRTDRATVVRDADRPFTSAPAAVRRVRNVAGALAVLMLAGAVIALVVDRRSAQQDLDELQRSDVFERADEVRFSDLAAFEGVEFADRLKDEQDTFSNEYLVASEVGGYDAADFAGEFTNVSGGVRRTLAPPACDGCPAARMWIAGGSSAFGLGQRDEHTIASELVRLAAAEGVALEVVNVGVPGYTIHQEAQKVLAMLDDGVPPPELIVFYDGYNDVVGTVMDSTVNGVHPDEPALLESDVARRFTGESHDPWAAGTPETLGALAAQKYRREASAVAGALAERGIETRFVFQPDALASDRQYDTVSEIYELNPRVRTHLDGSLAAASSALEDTATNLRHLLDEAAPVFADLVHTNELGAQLVARSIFGLTPWGP